MDHVEFARLGGKARAKKLGKTRCSEIARAAVNARWEKDRAAKKKLAKRSKRAA